MEQRLTSIPVANVDESDVEVLAIMSQVMSPEDRAAIAVTRLFNDGEGLLVLSLVSRVYVFEKLQMTFTTELDLESGMVPKTADVSRCGAYLAVNFEDKWIEVFSMNSLQPKAPLVCKLALNGPCHVLVPGGSAPQFYYSEDDASLSELTISKGYLYGKLRN